jgi:mannose-1-phosphate guanylyltransferase
MKAIIFAGGSGKRFWPISRKKLPKQFIPLLDDKSTFQMQIDRIRKIIGIENVFVSTNEIYVSIIKKQVPDLPTSNIIGEPEKKDILAALGLVLMKFQKLNITEPIIYLASDHLIKRYTVFRNAIKVGRNLIKENSKRFIYFGEKPLYATNNLGWINIGKEIQNSNNISVTEFKKWIYRPDINKCRKMFKTRKWVWNVNYEIFTVPFALEQYKKHFPGNFRKLQKIYKALGTRNEAKTIREIYLTLDEAHSDALWASAKPSEAVVLNLDMGWSDPGTLFALKQELEKNSKDNVTKGKVFNYKSENCLVYNYQDKKLVATLNLKDTGT